MTDNDRLNLRGAVLVGDLRTMSRAASAIDGIVDALREDLDGTPGSKRPGLLTALSLVAETLQERVEFLEERREEGL